jgi:hypothetical protein
MATVVHFGFILYGVLKSKLPKIAFIVQMNKLTYILVVSSLNIFLTHCFSSWVGGGGSGSLAFNTALLSENNTAVVLNELCFWTLSIVCCLKKQKQKKKIEELKYGQNITIYTSTKFTEGSITNHRATYLGAYTHEPLKQVRHRWQ